MSNSRVDHEPYASVGSSPGADLNNRLWHGSAYNDFLSDTLEALALARTSGPLDETVVLRDRLSQSELRIRAI